MTKAQDIRQLIAEEAIGTGERRALEQVADSLDRSLSKDVPARPEFKAQLRRQLMAQARRNMAPWYKRPAVWGSTMGVAAAAAVLAVGLNMFSSAKPMTPVQNPGAVSEKPGASPGTQSQVNRGLTGALPELKQPAVPDEELPAGAVAEAGAPAAGKLEVLRLTGKPDEQALTDIAGRLGIAGTVQRNGTGWSITQGSRTLEVRTDGQVIYSEPVADQPGAARIAGPEAARTAARQFLQAAVLPVPDLQPVVRETGRGFEVTYTPRVQGRPVANGRTRVLVSPAGRVLELAALLPAGEISEGFYDAYSAEEGIVGARARGGTFAEADLVWVRTVTESQAIYLQPYWRVFGTNAQGARIARYVPAMKP